LAGLLRTIRTRLLGNGITWLLRNHHEDSREKGGQQKATQAGREGNDTSGQPLFTLCLEGYGEDVGASSPFDQIPEGGEQLFIRQVLNRTI
jgi:hypothetical protein